MTAQRSGPLAADAKIAIAVGFGTMKKRNPE